MTVSDLKIVAVGSNDLLANELADAIALILGDHVHVDTCLSGNITAEVSGDLFVCNKSQVNNLLKLFPVDKILILNLTPTTQFFVELAQVPPGEKVHVFNNRLQYALQLAELCEEMNANQLRYVPVAYEEMNRDQIGRLLHEAKYIVGVDRLLGPEVLFSEAYRKFLRSDVTVIRAQRVAAISSACALVKWMFLRMQKDISSRVSVLTENINRTMQTQDIVQYEKQLSTMAEEIKKLAGKSGQISEFLQGVIMQSIITQFNANRKNEGDLPTGGDTTIQNVRALLEKLKEFR